MFTGVLGTSVSVPGSQEKDTGYLFRKIVIPTRILYILGAGEVVGRRETPTQGQLRGASSCPYSHKDSGGGGGDFDFLEAKPEEIGLRFAIKQYQGTESKEQETWLCLGTHLKPPAGRKTATRPACTAYQNTTKPVSVLLTNGHKPRKSSQFVGRRKIRQCHHSSGDPVPLCWAPPQTSSSN